MGRDTLIVRVGRKAWLYFPTKEATPLHFIGGIETYEEVKNYLDKTRQ